MRLFSSMRVLLAVSISAFAIASLAPTSADAQSRGARKAKAEKQLRAKRSASRGVRGFRVAHRAASVGANGLCQRDTGTPESQLDFRNPCDAEEFWRRINDRGGAGER